MRALLAEMIKSEPSIVVVNPTDQSQLVLAKDPLPTNEAAFKKYFTISTETRAKKNQQHVIVGCAILSERTLKEIKFDKTRPQLMNWLDREKVFIESDSLGVVKTTTIGYITKLHPVLTNRTTLKSLLQTALEEVVIDADLAVELDPDLKDARLKAKANGDFFNPELPPFEIYKTKLTQKRDKDKVETNVLGIKSTPKKAKLLQEFFSQLASPTYYEKQIGVFVPTGAVHLLGAENYIKLIRDNNAFIHSVLSIPLGDFQHETLDIPFSLDSSTDIDQTTLLDVIAAQEWCLSIEKTTTANKVLITTTKSHLETARQWIDHTLPSIYDEHIADKIDVTTLRHLTPRRLDKPVLTAASSSYADKLKARTSNISSVTTTTKQYAKPPRPKTTPKVDINFDEKEFPLLASSASTAATPPTTSATGTASAAIPTTSASTKPYDYKAEMDRILAIIENNLKQQFATMFSQMEQRIEQLEHRLAKLEQRIEQQTTQQAANYAEQQQVNEQNTQQLSWVVENMQKFFKYTNHGQFTPSPSPLRGEGNQ